MAHAFDELAYRAVHARLHVDADDSHHRYRHISRQIAPRTAQSKSKGEAKSAQLLFIACRRPAPLPCSLQGRAPGGPGLL